MKYDLSIVLMVRDEDVFLEEFVAYYLVQGVDHFYIFDNKSLNPVEKILSAYRQWCTFILYPEESRGRHCQAFAHFLNKYGKETKWAAFIDIDEFILPKKFGNLKQMLEDKKYKSYDAIGIHWVMFGPNGHEKRPEGLVIDNYLRCQAETHNHIKTILKPSSAQLITPPNPHYFKLLEPRYGRKPKYVDPHGHPITKAINEQGKKTTDVVQICHFWCKSHEDYLKKIARPRANAATMYKNTNQFTDEWKQKWNAREETLLRDKYSKHVKNMIKHFRAFHAYNPQSYLTIMNSNRSLCDQFVDGSKNGLIYPENTLSFLCHLAKTSQHVFQVGFKNIQIPLLLLLADPGVHLTLISTGPILEIQKLAQFFTHRFRRNWENPGTSDPPSSRTTETQTNLLIYHSLSTQTDQTEPPDQIEPSNRTELPNPDDRTEPPDRTKPEPLDRAEFPPDRIQSDWTEQPSEKPDRTEHSEIEKSTYERPQMIFLCEKGVDLDLKSCGACSQCYLIVDATQKELMARYWNPLIQENRLTEIPKTPFPLKVGLLA